MKKDLIVNQAIGWKKEVVVNDMFFILSRKKSVRDKNQIAEINVKGAIGHTAISNKIPAWRKVEIQWSISFSKKI